MKAAPKTAATFADGLVKAGQPPLVGTVIYIHGIGNKPEASILKCQWDRALFGAEMGDRTRFAYWVDRERYPSPEDGTSADGERLAATATGKAKEVNARRREKALDLYLAKHPHLREFVYSPTCAFFEIRVQTFFVVTRFQHVLEVHVKE